MSSAKHNAVPNNQSVKKYIDGLSEAEKKDAELLVEIFKDVTDARPVLWNNMIGFGSYHYTYESGREGDMFATGFAIRKSGPTIYIMPGYQDYGDILKDIGPHKLGKSCLYIKRLDDINIGGLKKLIRAGLRDLKKMYPVSMSKEGSS